MTNVKKTGCNLLMRIISFFLILFYIAFFYLFPQSIYDVGTHLKGYYTEIYDLGKEKVKFDYKNKDDNNVNKYLEDLKNDEI